VAAASLALVLNFALDHRLHTLAQGYRRHQQLAIRGFRGIPSEEVKQVGAVGADGRVAGQHSDVGIKLRGDAVVIPG